MKYLFFGFIIVLSGCFTPSIFAQDDAAADSIEVIVIESFIPQEKPNEISVTFFASEPVRATLVLNNEYSFDLGEEFKEEYKVIQDISQLKFALKEIKAFVKVVSASGSISHSEEFYLDIPEEFVFEGGSGEFSNCLLGGVLYLIPTFTAANFKDTWYYGIGKEFSLFTITSNSTLRPIGYFGVEYQYLFKKPRANYLRIGYKHVIEMPIIEFISPGVLGYTNFIGQNGVSVELSVGLFKLTSAFTVVTKGRFSFSPGVKGSEFNEVSLGLQTNFFTFHL